MKKRIRIQGFLSAMATLAAIVFAGLLFPSWQSEPWDEVLDITGVAIILFGFLIRIAARGYKREMSGQGDNLITDGPYGLIRHPMYFGTLLIGMGIVVILFEWWVMLIFLAIFLIIYIPQIRREERILLEGFGNEYKKYCKITPQYFFNIFKVFESNIREKLFFKINWVKKELNSLIATICIITGLEIWADISSFGHSEFHKELIEFIIAILFFASIYVIIFRKSDVSIKSKSN